jgi:hypothetical protein
MPTSKADSTAVLGEYLRISRGEAMRLNGWQRIGIVLSIVWAVGAAIHTRNAEVATWERLASTGYTLCMEAKQADYAKCSAEMSATLMKAYDPYWPNIGFAALAPVLAGWIVAYLLLWIFRWVKRGFDARGDD